MRAYGRNTAFVLVALTALYAGCGGVDGSEERSHLDELPALALSEELRVGSVDDPEIGFAAIGGAVVDGSGRVYVFETRDRQIRVFDPEGRPLHRIGGPGEGPGEFSSRVAQPLLYGLIGDTLWVNDQGAARVTFFSLSGAVLRTERLEPIVLEGDCPDFCVNGHGVDSGERRMTPWLTRRSSTSCWTGSSRERLPRRS